MKNIIFILLIVLMSGCTYYQTAPGTYYASGSSKSNGTIERAGDYSQ